MDDPVRRLMSELSTEEKLSLLHQAMPAVERLGLESFHTGAEAAHGVAWCGLATVFPQPVGMAAGWDPELVRRVGEVVGTELRAKRLTDPAIGLNVWAPVVNPLRHPRWGRNEEGFSEDPWLTGVLATAYAGGLRGRAERWRVVPTLKHFCGYNNETDRDVSSSNLRRRVLHEYEYPAFRVPIEAGVIGAVMASYNLVNGRPAHVSADLLDDLRSWTEESILVVSDAYAPGNIAGSQHYLDDHPAGYGAALRAGMDSYTQDDARPEATIAALHAALDRGLIGAADVDRAVERVLRLRGRTGELDGSDPYRTGDSAVGVDDLDRPEHRQLAREAVASSVVLLRNDGLLPLRPSGKIAVIGPMAERVLCDWYSGTPPYRVSLAEALGEVVDAPGEVRVADGSDRVALRPLPASGEQTLPQPAQRLGYLRDHRGVLSADGALVDGSPEPDAVLTVTDWGHGVCTIGSADGKLWTVPDGRWVRAEADRVGGWEVQESFRVVRQVDGSCCLQHLGTRKWLRVDAAGGLCAEPGRVEEATRFQITVVSDGRVAAAQLADWADTVIVAVGNEPHLLGRETEDRPDLELPDSQAGLVSVARAACDRTVLMIISSYPYALDDVAADSPAILWSSHGGQELGHGLVDILTGAVEPGGRLPQTWPRHSQRLPDLFDYDIISAGATYWYDDQQPLFGFGHGLGYSDAEYRDLQLGEGEDAVPETVSVTVSNVGDRSLTEVIQVYVAAPNHRLSFPRRLAGFDKVIVPARSSVRVTVPVRPEAFMIFDVVSSEMITESGEYRIEVGRSALDIRATATVSVDRVTVGPHALADGVEAAAFDDADRVRIVPRDVLRGDVVEADNGRISFLAVDTDGRPEILLRARSIGRAAGTVTVLLDGCRVGSVGTGPDWADHRLRIGAASGRLELLIHGAAVDIIRTVTDPK